MAWAEPTPECRCSTGPQDSDTLRDFCVLGPMTAETHTEFISIFRKPRGGGGRRDLLRRVRRGRGVPYRHVRAHAVGDGVRSLTPTCAASAPHGDPLLFLAASRRGRAVALAIDTALYVLSRSRLFTHMWDLLHSTRRVCPGAVSARTAMVVLGRVAKVCCVRETVASFQRLLRMFRAIYLAALFNKLLRTLGQEQSMTDARNSAEDAEMRKLGVEPDPMTYNSLIDCHGKNKDVHKALKLLDEMRDKDISPDVITYTRLIGGLGLIGQPDKAKDLLKEMHELGCYPDVPAYNEAIAKRLGDVLALMDEMASKGLKPNPTTHNLFFRSYYLAFDIGRRVCMFIITLCHRHGKVAQAFELWSDMLEDAERCFYQMVELGQKPSYVAFRRIQILLQLAKQEESIARLTEKIAQFGRLAPEDCQRVHHPAESRPSNGDGADIDISGAA
nr:unnamed protein product [Digitaria exilis]